MENITIDAFHSILSDPGNILIKTKYKKPKLMENSNDEIIKIFYPKKGWYSSNRRKPYALRFYQNAKLLSMQGIKVPVITYLKYCSEIETYIISYKKIPGENTRTLIQEGNKFLIENIAKFIATLHEKGIFFRAIHLENLLYQNGEFTLIDIDNVKFKNIPLNFILRYRNLKHMFLVKEDRQIWDAEVIKYFMQKYFQYANLSFLPKKLLSLKFI